MSSAIVLPAITRPKSNVNWDRAEEYLAGILPQFSDQLDHALGFLPTLAPYSSQEGYPQRIITRLLPKGILSPARVVLARELSPKEISEIRANQTQIAQRVNDVADRYNLAASSGRFIYDLSTERRILFPEIGVYTFQPNHNHFSKTGEETQ